MEEIIFAFGMLMITLVEIVEALGISYVKENKI